jgi:cyclophilin family peptidyl-prolyl cis-trans isomerase
MRRLPFPALAALCALSLLGAACGDDAAPKVTPVEPGTDVGGASSAGGSEGSETSEFSASVVEDGTEVSGGEPGGEISDGPTPCPSTAGTERRVVRFNRPPPLCINPSRSYTATVTTTKGAFAILLDDDHAPVSANNFVVLSRYHFYDGVAFHRVIPGFIDQTGDATGDPPGTGDAGYHIPDELPADGYPDFSVAMANAGPDTNGSQWFVVMPGGGLQLSSFYSRFGLVTTGQDVVLAINATGTANQTGQPTEVVTIQTVTITET